MKTLRSVCVVVGIVAAFVFTLAAGWVHDLGAHDGLSAALVMCGAVALILAGIAGGPHD